MSAHEESGVCQSESELEELCAFVDEMDSWINHTLSTLGWTREHVVKVLSHLLLLFQVLCSLCFVLLLAAHRVQLPTVVTCKLCSLVCASDCMVWQWHYTGYI